MNTTACGKPWTRLFLTEQFPKSFVFGSLKEHKKNQLFEIERSMLPATQPIVEEEIRKEKLFDLIEANQRKERAETKELRNSYSNCLSEIRNLEYLLSNQNTILLMMKTDGSENIEGKRKEIREKWGILKKESLQIQTKINKIEEKHLSILRSLRNELGVKRDITRKVFVRACPDGECRGFLSSQWKCGICDKWTCPTCHVVKGLDKDVEHSCSPDDVATAKLISSDTKPCPQCKTGIFKIDGCDQMFCTQCHTGFSWRTGNIETRIHNPHYFEWMARNRGNPQVPVPERNPEDVICGREIDTQFLVKLISQMGSNNSIIFTKITGIARLMIHMTAVEIPKFAVNDVLDNQDLRVQYLRGKMDETAFKVELLRRFKKQEIKREHRDLFVMFRNTVTDILYRIFDVLKEKCDDVLLDLMK
jgi:hypothetical protein